MNGTKQIIRNTTINTPASAVWAVLSDSRLLPEWAPAVDEVTECSVRGEAVGEVRRCNVRLAGKSGRMVERCTEFTPMTRIAYVVDDESFGMKSCSSATASPSTSSPSARTGPRSRSKRITRPEIRCTASSTG